jgi:uncharacterized protein (TIGR00661 family)
MKILYAIQGTGNGHLSRAHDVVPVLRNHAEVDILVSGTETEISIPYTITYRLKGMGFISGKSGGVNILQTLLRTDIIRLLREIKQLPVRKYDLIINDFEPVSAWAARWREVPIISLSHQCALLSISSPKPGSRDLLGEAILKYYAPADIKYGFHFHRFDKNIYTPVIRHQIRKQKISNNGHYTLYLPFYSPDKIVEYLSQFNDVEWHVFSKHIKIAFDYKNIVVRPVSGDAFVESLATCAGVFCGAGFETPAEALFMGKKLMVMPMHGQYEQLCNAAALEKMGVKVIRSLSKKYLPFIREWLDSKEMVEVVYPDFTESLITYIIDHHVLTYKSSNPGYQDADPVLF